MGSMIRFGFVSFRLFFFLLMAMHMEMYLFCGLPALPFAINTHTRTHTMIPIHYFILIKVAQRVQKIKLKKLQLIGIDCYTPD